MARTLVKGEAKESFNERGKRVVKPLNPRDSETNFIHKLVKLHRDGLVQKVILDFQDRVLSAHHGVELKSPLSEENLYVFLDKNGLNDSYGKSVDGIKQHRTIIYDFGKTPNTYRHYVSFYPIEK